MKKFLRKLALTVTWLTVSVLALAALFFLTAPLWQQRWIEPRPRVDWSPSAPPLQESDIQSGDAYDLLRQAGKICVSYHEIDGYDENKYYEEQKRLSTQNFSAAEFPLTALLLAQNEAALALFRKIPAADHQRFLDVTTAKDNTVTNSLTLGKALVIAAEAQAADGGFAGAFADLNCLLRVANTLRRDNPLIDALVANTFDGMAMATINKIVRCYSVPADLLKTETIELTDIIAQRSSFAETLRAEFYFSECELDKNWNPDALAAVLQMMSFFDNFQPSFELPDFSTKLKARLIFYSAILLGSTKAQMHMALNTTYQELLAVLSQPYDHANLEKFTQHFPPIADSDFFTRRNPFGYFFSHSMVTGSTGVYMKHLTSLAHLRAAQVSLAVSAFKQERGKLPLTLSELVPNYLPEIPSDPFDEPQPLRYQTTADGDWLIYSVGPDQKDDHGRPTNKNRATLDADGDLILSSAVAKNKV